MHVAKSGQLGGARRRRRTRAGFTLIEAALATIIVGVAVLAIVAAQTAFHKQNAWATRATVAMSLANEIRELTWNLPRRDPVTGDEEGAWGPEIDGNELALADFDDLDDFDGFGNGVWLVADPNDGPDPATTWVEPGPINARGDVIPGMGGPSMGGWRQIVQVRSVEPTNIAFPVPEGNDGTTEMVQVEVVVEYRGPAETQYQEMTRIAWVARR